MPRRAIPGNLATIEAALTAPQRAALAELIAWLGVDPAGWHTVPLLRVFVVGGVLNLADELHRAGSSREHSVMTAAVRCGVSFETVKTWRRRARLPVQDEPTVPSGATA